MSADEHLSALDQAHAAATSGPWHVAKNGGIDAGEYDTVIGKGDVDCMSHCYGGTSTIDGDNLPADAALIVAAVNALPGLTAALRAVLDLADELATLSDLNDERSREYEIAGQEADARYREGRSISYKQAAEKLYAAVTAALGVDGTGR